MTAVIPNYAVQLADQISLPVRGSALLFPMQRLFCVGRNYTEHAREMGHDPHRDPPFFFMKPAQAVSGPGVEFRYPALSNDVHHEIELVVALSRGGSNIEPSEALDHVFGYAIGLDMTRRDLQSEAKRLQRPWEAAKAFDGSAPCSEIVPASEIGHPQAGRIFLSVNGELKQQGDLADMIWGVPEILADLSRFFELTPGDLVFTGTPAGVGAVHPGDTLRGEVEGVGALSVAVTAG